MTDTPTEPAPHPHGHAAKEPEPKPNFGLGALAGVATGLGGAVAWAAVTYVTGYELGIIAVALGAFVGIAVRAAGKGRGARFSVLGAVLAGLSCGLGIVLSDVAFLAKEAGQPVFEVFGRLGVEGSVQLARQAGGTMDFLFVAIAVWEAWRFSVRPKPDDADA